MENNHEEVKCDGMKVNTTLCFCDFMYMYVSALKIISVWLKHMNA